MYCGSCLRDNALASELLSRGHDAVAVDLPGDDDSAGLARYADTVVEAIGDRTDLVLVGQSMGALTAPIVAERIPVDLIVLLNPTVPAPGETGGAWWENTGQGDAMREHAERIGIGPVSMDDLDTLFGHDVPPEVWIAGAAIRSASALTDAPARAVCTPCPTRITGCFAARISSTASATRSAPAVWFTSR